MVDVTRKMSEIKVMLRALNHLFFPSVGGFCLRKDVKNVKENRKTYKNLLAAQNLVSVDAVV